jgi:hypothetical protein
VELADPDTAEEEEEEEEEDKEEKEVEEEEEVEVEEEVVEEVKEVDSDSESMKPKLEVGLMINEAESYIKKCAREIGFEVRRGHTKTGEENLGSYQSFQSMLLSLLFFIST